MWLLILALVLLFISVLLSSYSAIVTGFLKIGLAREAQAYAPKVWQRQAIWWRNEALLICSNIVCFLSGIVMLFIATDWRWGLAGLAIYWLLCLIVLMPIMDKFLRPREW